MRYLAIFLLILNTSIAAWCLALGSWGWILSLIGIAVAVYMLVVDARYRGATKAMYKRWANEDAALKARIARYGHGEHS